jgi:RNA polymerase sigma-70 factor (ECF subfamily)
MLSALKNVQFRSNAECKGMDESRDQRHESFLRLFTANDAALRSYVRTLVSTRDDAAEIMQDISLVLWRKFETFQGHEDFRRWAFGVARFEVLAWRRDKARDRLVLSETALDALAVQVTSDVSRLDRQRAALEHCLEKLAEQQRSLLKAAYAPGARLEQVAQDAGRTLESLYKMLQRLRVRLADCVRRHAIAGEPS